MTRRDLWKAPTENGGLLIDPPLERVPELLETNRRRFASANFDLLGQPLREIRHKIQDSIAVVNDAVLARAGVNRPTWPIGPVVATGHQPELFHPGVWIKNFAQNGIARRFGLAPVHVIVDADTIKTTAILIPKLRPDPGHVAAVPVAFDAWTGEEPYSGREVRDVARFRGFVAETQQIWGDWPFTPLLPEYWPAAIRAYDEQARRLAEKYDEEGGATLMWCLAAARQATERRWGCANREQWLCLLNRQAFIGHILGDLPRFHAAYNQSVKAYRRKYRLRGRSHPVPDLAADGDFLEAPFWWVDSGANRRHRLFVRRREDVLVLRAGENGDGITVPRRSPFSSHEMQLTTRALTTTMFIRLCVADLFIHGIGGAKYDEVTDNIIRQYFGMEPPEYMVVSGTLRLPFPAFPAKADDCKQLQHKVRDLDWNPDRFMTGTEPWAVEMIAAKEHWRQAEPQTQEGRRERFRQLQAINANLRALVPPESAQQLRDSLSQCQQELRANEILQRRDYAFVLYPEEMLRQFCTQVL